MFNYCIYVIGSGRSNAYIFLAYILLVKAGIQEAVRGESLLVWVQEREESVGI